MIRCRWIFASLTLAAIAGCQVDHDKEMAVYRDVLEAGIADPPIEPPSIDQPIKLREALLLANRLNEQLAAQGETYLRAHIQKQRAVANFLPTVDLIGTQAWRDDASSSDGGNSSGRSTADITAGLNANLFNGFRDVNAYWAQTWAIEEARHELLDAQESLLLDVARIYYQVLRSEAQVQVLENSLQVQLERLRDTRGRYDAGLSRPLDVAQTEAQVSQTRSLLIDAKNDVKVARSRLVLLSGAQIGQNPLSDNFEVPDDLPTPDAFTDIAQDARNDLRSVEAAILVARRNVEVAFGQYYPTISIDLNAFLYRETTPTGRDWEAILRGGIPLFAAGRIHADVREAWSFFRQAMLLREYTLRQVRQEVSTAYVSLQASGEQLVELTTRVSAAEQAFQQAEASYAAGLATNLDRVQAQDELLSAQLQLTSERFDRKITFLELVRASGRLHVVLQDDAGTLALVQAAARPSTRNTQP